MNTPKLIYLNENLIKEEAEPFWLNTKYAESDIAYFSEKHVREILKQVVNDANHLVDISTTLHKTKLDADKYIPHVMELLLKGGEK